MIPIQPLHENIKNSLQQAKLLGAETVLLEVTHHQAWAIGLALSDYAKFNNKAQSIAVPYLEEFPNIR